MHREIVVVGSQPTHSRVILDRLANRGYLGVQLLNLTPELRQHFGASRQSGILVSRVVAGGPAEAAGVAVGDVITTVDGAPVRTTSQLIGRIGRRQEGDEVELGILRDRSALTLRATLSQSERRQMEVGQFVWRGGDDGAVFLDVDPDTFVTATTFDPDLVESVIAVDPEAINESVSRLLQRLEEGGLPGHLRLDGAHREQLEKRIAELEARLEEMEQLLRRRHRGGESNRHD